VHPVFGSNKQQEAATAYAYSNNWVDYDGGSTFETGAYYKDNAGRVHLRGLIKRGSGTPTPGETMVTLPTGYRPARRLMFFTATDTGGARVEITSSGTVLYIQGGYGFLSLEGLSFKP